MAEPVLFDVSGEGVATITLNRPERLNAINIEMRDLLWTYFQAVRDMPGLHALVFRGEGTAFSAGADISEFGTSPSIMDARRARHDRDLWWLLLNLQVPTIARMHGFCFGAGLELPLLCDYRIAAEGTTVALPEVTLGYIPSACGTQTLQRIAGPSVAAGMILTGERVTAVDALTWEILDEVVPADELDAAVGRKLESFTSAANAASTMERRREMLADNLTGE
ncbi:MAG: enoyl-CoA hydratase/isomerase family protein [Dehalococcoidia bacterium]|nr:enoyl-CoA hydratase/isomerase family protein [Dehalococcoidia bacterium]